MSKASTPSSPSVAPVPTPSAPKASAWARGPPVVSQPTPSTTNSSSATNSRPSSPKQIAQNGSSNQNGGGHSRKPSVLAGGRAIGDGVVVGRGAPSGVAVPGAKAGSNINFGSIDDSTATLSSSPATHPSTGSHLETAAVRAFGSVVAAAPNGTNPSGTQRPQMSIPSAAPATASSPAQAAAPAVATPSATAPAAPAASTPAPLTESAPKKKPIDVHALFQSQSSGPPPSEPASTSTPSAPSGQSAPPPPPQPLDRRGSSAYESAPRSAGPPPPGGPPQHPYGGQQFYPQQQQQQGPPSSHLRPPQPQSTPRSPPHQHQQPQGAAQQQQGGPGSPFPRPSPIVNGRPQQQGPGAQQQQQQQQGPSSSPRPGHQQMQGMPPQFYPPQHQQHPGMPYGYYYPPMDQQYQYYGGPPPPQFANQPYGSPYPQHQQQQQQMPLSPRGAANVPLSSPSPSSTNPSQSPAPSTPQHRPANLTQQPSSSSIASSPAPHAHSFSRPSSFSQSSAPFSPSAHQQQPPYGGQPPSSPGGANLRVNAVEFQPAKKSSGIKFTRPDGTALELKDLAQKTAAASPAPAPAPAPSPSPTPVKPAKADLPKPPVTVRIETSEQHAARVAEEEKEKRMKELEKKEDAERKEREEKRKIAAKEKEEKEAAEKKAAEEAEAKRLAEEEEANKVKAAEEEAAKAKAAEEEKKAAEAKKVEEEAAEKKRAEEAEAKKVEEEAAKAAEAEAAKKVAAEEEAKKAEKAEEVKTESEKPVESEKAVVEPVAPAPAAAAPPPIAAGLPPKPSDLPPKPVEAALDALKTKTARPSNLDLSSVSGSVQPPLPSAVAQSLQSARFISEPNATTYPEGIRSPLPELNASAPAGKFRYDRDFLLQFMEVCKEKPESLPSLESIGLEADNQSGGGFRRGAPSRSGSSMGPPSRSSSFAGTSRTGAPAGGFSMGMGSFGTGSVGKTSADRFAQSQGGMLPSRTPMSRQPSAGSSYPQVPQSPGGAKGARVRSERGRNRSDAPAFPVPTLLSDTPVAPLVESANRWTAGPQKRGQPVDENSPAVVDRKVKGLLNKLTMENFDSISGQILTWANKSEDENDGRTLRQVIKLIFEKATDEAHWSEMYARLCRKMMDTLGDKVSDEKVVDSKGNPVTGGSLFRKYLLNRCQEDFEKGWAARESSMAAAASKATEDKAKIDANDAAEAAAKESGQEKPKEEAALMSDEYYIAQKAKRQGLGLVRLIGELFKLEMLTERIMHECVKRLLANVVTPEEEDIESLCRLLTTVGKTLDSPKAKPHMDVYFSRMNQLRNNPVVASRMQFMLLEVVELRSRHWKERNETQGVQTLAQIREKAASDAQRASQDSMNRSSSQRHGGDSSRGGSRRGQTRTDFGAPQQGQDGWTVAAPPRNPGKVGDLAHFGKIEKRGAASGPQTFGPSTVFGKNRGAKIETPPMSRVNSNSNMFSLLNQDGSSGAEPASSEPQPERKRLVLKPRTVGAKEGEEGEEKEEGEGEEEQEGEEETPAAGEPEMPKEEADRLIKTRVAEFYNVKDLDEAVLQLKELPDVYVKNHVEKLVSYAMDAKVSEFDLTVKLFTKAAEESAVQAADFKAAFASTIEFLDDLVSDVPKAYTLAAKLLAAAKLSKEEVETLGDTINLDNEPVDSPKERLVKEWEAANEVKAE